MAVISVKDAQEIVRLNTYLGDLRKTLAAIDGSKVKSGTIIVNIVDPSTTSWGEGKDYKISHNDLGKVALGYVRAHYQGQVDACIRKLNALGGEVLK